MAKLPIAATLSGRPAWLQLATIGALGLALSANPALAQLSTTSWWPKYARDAQNSGAVPQIGFAADVHVVWAARLSAPIAGENHATPVLSADNTRLYVGGPASKLSAINVIDGSLAWQLTLGDGTGVIFQSAAVGADGSLFVGCWDSTAPYDGFSKVRDNGASASIEWTFPLRRGLASPTITAGGLIVVAGQHATDGWRYFALADNGSSYSVAWTAGLLANAADPNSTGRIGGTPALSLNGAQLFGGSDQNRTFWQILTADGIEQARLAMNAYCFATPPTVATDGRVFIGEGQSFSTPSDSTEGRLNVFELDASGQAVRLDALALANGHLNGGIATRTLGGGRIRTYVAANGNGKPTARLIAVEFDPARRAATPPAPALVRLWDVTLGASAFAYPAPVVLADALVYAIGPANHTLYAIRDIDAVPAAPDGTGAAAARGATLWTVDLSTITRVAGWTVAAQRGPQSPVIGPDGTIYWNAPDGYLYALRGWQTGDLDGNGQTDAEDVALLTAAAADRADYELRFPEVDLNLIGDVDGSGAVAQADATRLAELLAP